MLEPKRRKYRKEFRGRRRGLSIRGADLSFGEYGLKSLGRGWLSSKQIEAGRRAITYSLRKGGKVWIRVFPAKPVTSRPAGHRMGGGKGEIDRYVAVVRPGKILYEVAGISEDLAKSTFAKVSAKMPFKTKFISKI
ncbi:50S ribosomal protein L16 [Candidatus Woesebacteria bacterium RBG_13_34_9]|uniref:Large ribosomal subunit protein uL16 n=1 Tax=Candidatus Woesebacteria bacterium RBG_13_34_9 TaxID=1802477 RepID=A0A1F7X407_9BACT|nr:MAG: 50S ribosomal protein L16 [Candidatus Woesebacteria bacterium RBG_13_34_9]